MMLRRREEATEAAVASMHMFSHSRSKKKMSRRSG
jgi:hypothetical protein